MRLQGENQLVSTMLQTIAAFHVKLKPWQAPMKANDFIHLDMLAKHSPVIGEKYAALFFHLTRAFENRFQDFQENSQ